jgi:hypothetical protein
LEITPLSYRLQKEKMANQNAGIFWVGVRQNKGESMLDRGFKAPALTQ